MKLNLFFKFLNKIYVYFKLAWNFIIVIEVTIVIILIIIIFFIPLSYLSQFTQELFLFLFVLYFED